MIDYMKRYLPIFILVLLCSSCATQHEKLKITNGMFFYEKPEQVPYGSVVAMATLEDSIWGTITILDYPQLSEAAKKYAIPTKKIKNGEEILRKAANVRRLHTTMLTPKMNVGIGDALPDFTLRDIKGREWSNMDLMAKKTVINFWFTGCGPCIKEMPELGRWVRKYRDVTFLAVTFESAERIEQIIKDNKFRFHQLVNDDHLGTQVGVSSYPFTVVLDEEGRITLIEVGTSPVQRENIVKAINK